MTTLPAVFNKQVGLTIQENRERFEAFEQELFNLPQLETEDYSLVEYKIGDLYARQITIKKGVCLTGRVYKRDHLEVMLSGDIIILSADGGTTHYTGHNVIEAKAGKRQAGFALEDTIWLTVNVVPNQVKENLDFTSVLSFEAYEEFLNKVNNIDFKRFIIENQSTESVIQLLSEQDDLVDLPEGYDNLYISESSLSGNCVKSSLDIEEGQIIGPATIDSNRTILGRYCNHALFANTTFRYVNGLHMVIAVRRIPASEEITMNYREVLNYRYSEEDLCQVG